MPPKPTSSNGGSGRSKGRPSRSSYISTSNSLGERIQQPLSTPARNVSPTQGGRTPGRSTRRSSAPLEEMHDNPDRIMRAASKTPSRKSSIASNASDRSSQGHRPSAIAPFNHHLSLIVEEEANEDILYTANVPLPSIETAEWSDSDFEIVATSPRSKTLGMAFIPRSSRGNTPTMHNPADYSLLQRQSSRSESREYSDSSAGKSPSQTGPWLVHTPSQRTGSGFPLPSPRRRSSTPSWATRSEDELAQSSRKSSEPQLLPLRDVGQGPSSGDPVNPGVEGEVVQSLSLRRSFLSILWGEVKAGTGYFYRWRWGLSLFLAILLLATVLCSAGRVCEVLSIIQLIAFYASSSSGECFCILIVYSLMISGLFDSVMATVGTVKNIGVRAAQRQGPLFQTWRGFFRNTVAYFSGYIASIWVDVVNIIFEPVAMLGLMIALRDWRWLALGLDANTSPAIQAFFVSGVLHFLKWVCQSCEIRWNLQENVAGFRWARKPLVFLLLLLLSIIAIRRNWNLVSSAIGGRATAAAYYNSDKYPRTGDEATIRMGDWITQPTKEAATQVYRVTQLFVTSGVLSTMVGI